MLLPVTQVQLLMMYNLGTYYYNNFEPLLLLVMLIELSLMMYNLGTYRHNMQ